MKMICRLNGSTAMNFTDGKVYEGHPVRGDQLRIGHFYIKDDHGLARVVKPDELSWLLMKQTDEERRMQLFGGVAVGVFETYRD